MVDKQIKLLYHYQDICEQGKIYSESADPSQVLSELTEMLKSPTLLPLPFLTSITKSLITRKFQKSPPSWHLETNNFIRTLIKTLLGLLKKDSIEHLTVILRLLKPTKKFYESRYTEIPDDLKFSYIEALNLSSDSQANIPILEILSSKLNFLYQANLQLFFQEQGFEKLTKIVTENIPYDEIIKIMTFFLTFQEISSRVFWRQICKDLKEKLLFKIQALTDEEVRTVQKSEIKKFFIMFEGFLQGLYDKNKCRMILETAELNLAYRFLTSKYLEKRIIGLTEINSKISQVKNRESGFYSSELWLDSEFLIPWIEAHDLLEVIFGSTNHQELIKRSKDLVKFLYLNSRFDRNNIGKLWDCAVDRHETHKVALISLFTDLCEHFKMSDLQFMFSKVIGMDLSEIDSQTLALLKAITLYMCKYSSKSNDAEKIEGTWKEAEEIKENFSVYSEFGYIDVLEFLWKLCQENILATGVTLTVSKQAFSVLKDVLSMFSFKGDRFKFLIKCIENLKKNTSVIMSCKLIEEIILSYGEFRSNYDESKSVIIKNLDREFHILSEMFTSLLLFKTEAVERIQLNMTGDKLESSREDVCYTCSSEDDSQESEERGKKHSELFKCLKNSDMNYFEELKFRLNFIRFLFTNCSETFQVKQIQVVWEAIVLNAVSEEEFEIFFSWLSNCIEIWFMGGALVNEELTHFIFTDLFLKLDPRCLSPEGYKCYEKLFISLNKQHGVILNEFHNYLEVRDSGLLGVQYLWEIILKAKQKSVFRMASRFLYSLFKGIKQSQEVVVDEFLRTVLEFVAEGVEMAQLHPELDYSVQILRSVIVLTEFVQDFEKNEGFEISVKNHVANTFPKTFKISVSGNSPVKTLKNIIAGNLSPKVNVNELILFVNTKKIGLKLERKLVKELEIAQGVINVYQGCKDFDGSGESLDENLTTLQGIFPCFSEDLLITALENCNNKLEDAVNMLVNDDFVSNFELKQESNNKNLPVKEAQNISAILSNTQNYFSLLFSLFDLKSDPISNQVWKLLKKIPINSSIFSTLQNLNNIEWASVLSPTCSHKLLYGLNIIKEILSLNSENWKKKFLQAGGLGHLYSILMYSHKIESQKKSLLVCLELLIKTVKVFITDLLLDATNEALDRIDFTALIIKMLEIIEDCVSKELEGTVLIESALDFMVPIIVSHPFLLSEIYRRDSFNSLINYLLDSEKNKVRESIKFTILSIVESIPCPPGNLEAPIRYFSRVLLEKLPETSHSHCDEYFEVLVKLVSGCEQTDNKLLFRCLVTIERLLNNAENFEEQEENLLSGYLNLATILFNSQELNYPQLVTQVYSGLFENQSKLKSESTKKSAFAFLLSLSKLSSVNYETLIRQIAKYHLPRTVLADYPLIDQIKPRPDLDFSQCPSFDSEILGRSRTGFVGLINFGATCYLNSLLQQLFMIKPLRIGIQEAEIQVEDAEESLEDNLVYQLKVVFWNLQESDKQYFEPLGFCKAFKDYEGQPLNMKQQQDVDEFFNLLHDKIEEILKPSAHRNLLKNCVCGTFAHEIESLDPEHPYKSVREETFYRISLDIKNKNILSEALDLFVKEDILDDDNKYYCDMYSKELPAKKRYLISSLSNTVFIHLKRFEFNYNTMQRIKINDYCEFPISLDLRPWSDNSHIDDAYYLYELVGVLVHSGSADSGHYYSIIKDREQNAWFKFDDKYVEKFDLSNLKDECFGGESLHNWNYDGVSFGKTRNAYMLIYQRTTLVEVVCEDKVEPGLIFVNPSERIRQGVKKENKEFLQDKFWFSSSYSDFLKGVLDLEAEYEGAGVEKNLSLTLDLHKKMKLAEIVVGKNEYQGVSLMELEARPEVFEAVLEVLQERKNFMKKNQVEGIVVKVCTVYALEVLFRAKQVFGFIKWIKRLVGCYKKNPMYCVWILQFFSENWNVLVDILVGNREADVRLEFRNFLVEVVRQACDAESEYLFEKIRVLGIASQYEPCDEDPENLIGEPVYTYETEYISTTSRFLKQYLDSRIKKLLSSGKNFTEYLLLIKHLAMLGGNILQLLTTFSVISTLLFNYLSDFTHNLQVSQNSEKSLLIEISSNLIQKSMTRTMISSNTLPPRFIKTPFPILLSPEEESELCSSKTIEKLVTLGKNQDILHILMHLLWENPETSKEALNKFVSNLFDVKFEQNRYNAYLKVGYYILSIQDSYKYQRVQSFLSLKIQKYSGFNDNNTFFPLLVHAKASSNMFFNSVLIWWSDLMKFEHVLKASQENSIIFKDILDLGTGPRYEHGIYMWDYMDNSRQLFEELRKAYNKLNTLTGTEESEPENSNNNLELSSQDSDTESI